MSNTKLECHWPVALEGVSCAGIVEEVVIFNGQLKVSICEEHLKHHKMILALHCAGKDIKEVLHLSPDERIKMIQDMGLSLDKI